jgi:L-threonylcarbamoyladenylate synthase
MLFDEDLRNSLNSLKNGGVIIYPTDTIWGFGCDAANQSAVERINRIKSRSDNKSLIILVNGVAMLERYVREVPAVAYDLIEVSDTPLTIIYPEGKSLAAGICSEDGSVGIRICHDDFCSELITRFRRPLVSTSANRSGEPFPSCYSEIDKDLLKEADYIVKYRQEDRRKNSPSPVIKIDKKGVIEIIRK